MSMKVSFESNVGKPKEVVMVGTEMKEVEPKQVKADARQELWDLLDDKGIAYKKNMSKAKLEELLED